MKPNATSIALLSLLVVSIYVMRDGDLSFTKPLTRTVFRRLYDYVRPTSGACVGVSLTDSFSDAEVTRAKNLQNSLASTRGGNPLQTLLESGNVSQSKFVSDYAMGLIPSLAVWAAFFIISLVLCICSICNWCCMFGCCKGCKCCKCCKKPEGIKRKKFYALATILFMTGTFSAGIAGAAFSGTISKGMLVSYCTVLNMVEDLGYGNQSYKWLGLKGIVSSLDVVLDRFNTAMTNLNSVSMANTYTALDNKRTTVKNSLTAFNNAHNGDTVNRADPAGSPSSYAPEYIANLGPYTTDGKYLNLIAQEVDNKYSAITAAQQPVSDAVNSLKTQSPQIRSAIDSGRQASQNVFITIDNMVKSLNDLGSTVNSAIQAVGKAILGIFIAYIIIGLLPIASILLIYFLKIKFFSKILFVSWFLLGLLTILGFLICTIFYPVSVVFTELCQVLTLSLNDATFFDKTLGSALGGGQARDLTKECLFGQGNALDKLGLSSQIGIFDTIYTQLDNINQFASLTSSRPVPSVVIPYQLWYLGASKNGYIPDATERADLKTLDDLTNRGQNSCTNIIDTWILSATNCTNLGYVFQSGDASNQNLGSATCIGLDNWGTGRNSYDRYTASQFPSSCQTKNGGQQQLDYVKQFVTNFANQRAQAKTLFTNLVTDMTSGSPGGTYTNIQNAEADFGGELYDRLQAFKNVKSALVSLETSLTGAADGLIPNTNCKFISTDLKLVASALCTGFVPSIYQATVVLIVICMFSFLGTICVFCTAKRILNEDKRDQKHVTPNDYQVQDNAYPQAKME